MNDLEILLMRDRLTDKAIDLWKTYLSGQDAAFEFVPGVLKTDVFAIPIEKPLDGAHFFKIENKLRDSMRESIRRSQSRWIAYFATDEEGQDIMTINLRLGHITWHGINYFPVPTGRWLVTSFDLREVYQEIEKLLNGNSQFAIEQ